MKNRSLILMIVILMIMPVFIAGCSRDDVGIVRIEIQNIPHGDTTNGNVLFDRIFNFFVPDAYAVAGWTPDRTSLEISLTAPDLVDVAFPIPLSTTDFTMEIPAGGDRKISVYGSTTAGSFGKNWGGHAIVNLNPGDEKTIQINMLPLTKITSLSPSTDIQIYWDAVGAVYGVLGYRIHRSESAEGPYVMIKQKSDPTSGFDIDNPTKGKKYYYKVSVYTATSEGELSDSKSITW